MTDITLSCMIEPSILQLPSFEAQQRVQVGLRRMDWRDAWDRLLRVALDGQGPDISEIGSTWLGSLIDMNALRPLEAWSHAFGQPDRFFPAARWAITKPRDNRIWAIPFLTDTRAIFYRRDHLAKAGLDEATAFQSPATLVDTLHRLQKYGFDVPWAMPTCQRDVVYGAAPFIWTAGGHFRTQDGRHFLLCEPESLAGLRTFFGLHQFLSPPARGLDVEGTDNLFRRGEASVVLSGAWLLAAMVYSGVSLGEVGVAPHPGVPWIGGTHLVIWQHARNENKLVKLIQHLVSPEIQRSCLRAAGNLPARVDVLEDEPFASVPLYRAFAHSLKAGRVLSVSYRWAAVEKRLVDLLSLLWSDLATDPELDLDAEITARITRLVEELQHTLMATW